MRKYLSLFIAYCLILMTIPAYAGEPFAFEEQKPLTKEEIVIWKYKLERITVRSEFGRWEVVQGINTRLTDMQLLGMVNSENIATDRIKDIEFRQNLGNGISILGIGLALIGGIFASNLIKVDNGIYYGLGGITSGVGIFLLGNGMSPIISDEASHIITIDEAREAAEKYNNQLKKTLGIPDNYYIN